MKTINQRICLRIPIILTFHFSSNIIEKYLLLNVKVFITITNQLLYLKSIIHNFVSNKYTRLKHNFSSIAGFTNYLLVLHNQIKTNKFNKSNQKVLDNFFLYQKPQQLLLFIKLLNHILSLKNFKKNISLLIKSRLIKITPNLYLLLGITHTIMLMNKVGGLLELIKLTTNRILTNRLSKAIKSSYLIELHFKNSTNLNSYSYNNISKKSFTSLIRNITNKAMLCSRIDIFNNKKDISFSLICKGIIESRISKYKLSFAIL
mmetsp:Transcript_13344/g.18464  ORF Transcript_13344/g.18464 Transcript_13344/m.18464 type:complete len:261 (+) Transcript_13344:565-1347(+)